VTPARTSRETTAGLVVVAVLLLVGAVLGRFPQPVPLLFWIGVAGAVNAAFPLMRTFGSALLGGVAVAGVALSPLPFVTCSSDRFTAVFSCAAGAPTWHLTGAVLVAGLSGAGLVLARAAARADEVELLTRVERRLAAVEQALDSRADR
jgi:hypothetical protein